jgi:hypothetical protein
MGQTTSSGITRDEFKDAVVGTVVLMVARQMDAELRFRPAEQIDTSAQHVLPQLYTPKELLAKTVVKPKETELCRQYYSGDRITHIDRYIDEHILDSPEHMEEFLNLLIHDLRHTGTSSRGATAMATGHVTGGGGGGGRHRYRRPVLDSPSVSSQMTAGAGTEPAAGEKRLRRHMRKLADALDVERQLARRSHRQFENRPVDAQGYPLAAEPEDEDYPGEEDVEGGAEGEGEDLEGGESTPYDGEEIQSYRS